MAIIKTVLGQLDSRHVFLKKKQIQILSFWTNNKVLSITTCWRGRIQFFVSYNQTLFSFYFYFKSCKPRQIINSWAELLSTRGSCQFGLCWHITSSFAWLFECIFGPFFTEFKCQMYVSCLWFNVVVHKQTANGANVKIIYWCSTKIVFYMYLINFYTLYQVSIWWSNADFPKNWFELPMANPGFYQSYEAYKKSGQLKISN